MLDEQMQLRRQICDIKAQNIKNKLEIEEAKADENISKLEDLASLEKSVIFNKTAKEETEERIEHLTRQVESLLSQIQSELKSKDQRRVLQMVVQMKATQIENLELDLNLKFYEKLNKILMAEYKSMESILRKEGVNFYGDNEYSNEVRL